MSSLSEQIDTTPPAAIRSASWLTSIASILGASVALVGAGHLVAWLSGHMARQGFNAVTMKTNTALSLLLLGLGLVLLVPSQAGAACRLAGRGLAALAALIGLLSLSENLFGWNLGIDQLLAQEPAGALGVAGPNLMGTPAALSFILSGLAILLLCRRDGRGTLAAQILALAVCLIALLGTLGYLYGVQSLHTIVRLTGVAWPTSVALLTLGLGLLLARPTRGLMQLATADDLGGATLRRWLPVLLLPVILGWLRVIGERCGWFDAATGTATMMIIFILALVVLAYTAARPVSRSAADLQGQREWLQVTLASIGDAVIATDTSGLVTFINPVAEALTGWKRPEALGRSVQEVFRIINEQTGQPADDIVARVLREGAVALANHTAIQPRDGHSIPIEDSAAPIKDAAGQVTGVVLVFHDVTQKRRAQEALRESEERVRRKLESVLSPEGELSVLELADLFDVPALQNLMDDFYTLTRFPMALIDLQGKVLVGVGWQRICTEFHRIQPELCRHCLESDTELTTNVPPGEFRLYQCKNGLWDVATPVMVGGRHVGNLFTGQFFLDNETVNRDFFRAQARRYGLDEAAYLAALDNVPHMSREMVKSCMNFLIKLSQSLSQVSYSNVKLARLLTERERIQHETATASEFLKIINHSTSMRDLIQASVSFFRQQSGCEAIGVRLRDGEDFPYYEAHGFPEEFLLLENSLCELDAEGNIQRDDVGNPCIACMCGNVICGRFDPTKPFFSPNGSFWSNGTTALLASTTNADRQARTRNRCNGQGYESVALIPLRFGEERLGLLQINDRRQGMFTAATITIWERLASYLAVALAKLRAEEALAESRERLDLALLSARMATFDWDIVKNKRTWDKGVHQLLGTNPETFTGAAEEFFRIIHPDDRTHVQAALAKAIETTAPYETEYRAVWPDGSIRHIAARGKIHRDPAGRAVRMTGLCWDITDRKRAEADLATMSALITEGQEIAHVGSFEYVAETQTTVWSAEEFRIYGLDPSGQAPAYEEMLAKSYLPEDAALLQQTFSAAIQAGGVYELEHRILRPDGSIRWVYDRAHPHLDKDGKLARYVGATVDITERKQAEVDLRKAVTELERSNKELEQFAYISSHDLQEPLRQVQAFVKLLRERYQDKLDGKAAECLQFVYEGATRMSDLVRGLLEYSRVGARDTHRQETSCQPSLDAALANLQAGLAESAARVTHDELPTVAVEPTQLTQLFQNLVGNAVKFRRDGVPPEIHVSACREGSHWLLSVRDNGIGIKPEYHEKVFLIFQRLHTREKYQGTGIGLAICKKIVEQHGGRLWIESQIGQGSTFYFTLPQAGRV